MTSSDYNIKPVESLTNITHIEPSDNQKEKRKKQTPDRHEKLKQNIEDEVLGSIEEDVDVDSVVFDSDNPSIDYRA